MLAAFLRHLSAFAVSRSFAYTSAILSHVSATFGCVSPRTAFRMVNAFARLWIAGACCPFRLNADAIPM